MNHITIIGNLGKDPEMTYTPKGLAMTKCTLADHWERKVESPLPLGATQDMHWFNLCLFGKQAEYFAKQAHKGDKVLVIGSLVLRQWTNATGKQVFAHDVTVDRCMLLESKRDIKIDESTVAQDDGLPGDFPF